MLSSDSLRLMVVDDNRDAARMLAISERSKHWAPPKYPGSYLHPTNGPWNSRPVYADPFRNLFCDIN
ncbi:MAG: hypothetical protein JWM42_2603 [Burkholderia sp.]|nr:hypothetical protein [Burkholderia sp.]